MKIPHRTDCEYFFFEASNTPPGRGIPERSHCRHCRIHDESAARLLKFVLEVGLIVVIVLVVLWFKS